MIGILGFGRFGKLMASYLGQDFKVLIYDRLDKSVQIEKCGAVPAPLEVVCRQDFVILAVPISSFKDTLKQITSFLKEDAVVVDVCSVKELPVAWMKELLPKHISFLPTHPMFGPDSAADSLNGRKIVMCKERIDEIRYRKIASYLTSKGLIVIESTPREHDEQIAVSLALTHFIGRSLSDFGAKTQIIDTEGYKRLLHILEVVEHDTWQLFEDMNRYNPYAKGKRAAFLNALNRIEDRLSSLYPNVA